jgi:hypothetical protein
MSNNPKPQANTLDEIKELEILLEYENAMYETALAYPTETAQFYNALERNKIKIEKMYNRLKQLKEKLV